MPTAHILIVEDEGSVALDLAARLEKLGYRVAGTAASVEDAIRQAAELHPDLVLVDTRLRGKADRSEAAKTITSRLDIPVVYLTARENEATVDHAKRTAS